MNTTEITVKKESCKRFAIFGSSIGLFIPLILQYMYFHCHTIVGVDEKNLSFYFFILAILSLLPFFAYFLYDRIEKSNSKISDKWVDCGLYFIAALSLIFTYLIAMNTGGLQKSMLAYFFFFIPSAIAISFDAKISLIITCVFGGILVICLFLFPNNGINIVSDSIYKWLYSITIFFQFLSVALLELFNKNLITNTESNETK